MSDHDPLASLAPHSAEPCPTVGHGTAHPTCLQVLIEEEEAFQAEEARRHQEPPDARLRRWGEELRRGSVQCVVRLRAYGEARAVQGEVNEGIRSGQKMPILVWDERNGWKRSHAHNASKIYRAWARTESYPVSWAGLTVREILARLTEPSSSKARPTVNSVLSSWTRASEPRHKTIPHEVLRDTQPQVLTFTRRALEAFREVGQVELARLRDALRRVLDEMEVVEPLVEGVPRYVHASEVPEGLAFLSPTRSRNPARERMRRDPGRWMAPSGVAPVGLYRGKTDLYRAEDLVEVPSNVDPRPFRP